MRLFNSKTSLWVLFSLFLLPPVVQGQEEEAPEYELPEIVVTATRTEKSIKDLSATVSVITREDIEASNANSCTDILNTLPGLFVQRTGAFGRADVDIRGIGGRGRKVMVLVDGRPVKMGLFGCTVTHSLPLDNVERIEVVRGPASVLYGSDALGGVINIITRRPTKPMEMDYILSYGTHDTYQHRLRAGGSRGPLNFYATADKRQSDGHLPNSAYDGSDFTARVGYKIADNLETVLTGKYFDGHKEEPLRATDPDTLVSETWNDYERGAVDLTLMGRWERWHGSVKVYRNFGEHEFSPNDGWHSRDFTNGVMLHGSGHLLAGNELTAGAEFRQQGGKKLATAKQPRAGKWDKTEYAVFFHDEQILLGKLILTFGGRYNHDEVSGGVFCPQAGLVFHLGEGTILRGAVNKGFRSPQINEVYIFAPPNKPREYLKPEVVWNYEAGANQRITEGVYLDIVGFIMKGENLIQRGQNIGEFEFKGIETGLRTQISKGLSGRIYYTYLDPGEKTTGRPGDKVDLALRYARDRLAISLSGQYITDYFAGDSRKEPISDYLVANTKVSYKVIPGLQAFFAVDNILDKGYEIYADLPGGAAGLYSMPKRTFAIGMTTKF